MASHPSISTLERAVLAFRRGLGREALALAEAAWQMAEKIPNAPPEAWMAESWYGYLLGTMARRPQEGLSRCRSAAAKVSWDPRSFEFLARLELATGNRKEAWEALQRGLELAPDNPELIILKQTLGVRRPPPLPFLHRSNPVNILLGRLRSRLTLVTSTAH